jgi:flagellin
MEMASKGINVAAENMTSSESIIRDADMAKEMVDFTKNSILQQASVAMLSQANSQSQNVLQLLQ